MFYITDTIYIHIYISLLPLVCMHILEIIIITCKNSAVKMIKIYEKRTFQIIATRKVVRWHSLGSHSVILVS